MKTLSIKTNPRKKGGYTALLQRKMTEKKSLKRVRPLLCVDVNPKKIYQPYYKFYTVYKNETTVNRVSTNDFKPFQLTRLKIKAVCCLNSKGNPVFSIAADNLMIHGFISQVKAMEHAKAGALKYISRLIDEGEKSFNLLIAYREAHYEDLNFNLTEKNISSLK